MAVIDVNWNPNRKDLRIFAALLILFSALISYIAWWKTGTSQTAWTVFAIGATIGAVGVVVPVLIRPIYFVWMAAAFPIGWVMSHVILAIVFYFVFTPVGWLMKLFGKDPMLRDLERDDSGTYWIRRTPEQGTERYFKQY